MRVTASEGGVLYDKEKTKLLRCPEGKKVPFLSRKA